MHYKRKYAIWKWCIHDVFIHKSLFCLLSYLEVYIQPSGCCGRLFCLQYRMIPAWNTITTNKVAMETMETKRHVVVAKRIERKKKGLPFVSCLE